MVASEYLIERAIPGMWYVCRLPQIRRWDQQSNMEQQRMAHEDRRIEGPFDTEDEATTAQEKYEGGGPPSTEVWQCPPDKPAS